MTTYAKYKRDITRHEGNLADIVVELTNIDLSGQDINIQVRNKNDELVLEKSTLDSSTADDITISSDGTTLTIILWPEDTKEKPGTHQYEIDIINADGYPYITIGGTFKINAEVNTT